MSAVTLPCLAGEDVTRHPRTLALELERGKPVTVSGRDPLELRCLTTLAGWGDLDGLAVVVGPQGLGWEVAVPLGAWQEATRCSTAEVLSALLRDDCSRWHDAGGKHLDEVARDLGGELHRSARPDMYRWRFEDGSSLVVAGCAWDLPLCDDERCFCWQGWGRHVPWCPLSVAGPEDLP